MRLVIVHNTVSDTSTLDEQDVLVQADVVSKAIRSLGHEAVTLSCNLNLASIKRQLALLVPDLIFNLVESLDGQGRLIHLFPAMLDAMGLPYTGSQTEAIWMTSHKIMAKRHMASVGIKTPAWVGPYPKDSTSALCLMPIPADDNLSRRWIIKSLWEHASTGLELDSIIEETPVEDMLRELPKHAPRLGGACFAEEYIHGREFNISVLGGPDGPQVLPPAEIIFNDYDTSRPLIVGYRAKWEADSHEYHNTPRCFEFSSKDTSMLEMLKKLSIQCWHNFGLRGYARVDFRVDNAGQPWILEINTNPCISPDAGFAAAVNAAGIDFPQAVDRIICDGIKHHPRFANKYSEWMPY